MDINRGFETEQENQNDNYSNYYHNINNNSYNNKNPMQISTPNSGAALTFGIISIISICCCFPLMGIIGIIFAIISLALIPGAKKTYYKDPELYTQSSFDNIKAGQICAIIGLFINILLLIMSIFILSFGSSFDIISESFNEVWNGIGY